MFGEKYEKIPEGLQDGAGELMNIIFGYAKKILNEKGYVIEMAITPWALKNPFCLKHLKVSIYFKPSNHPQSTSSF